ncbi:hypothetical protein ACFL4L_07540, partial [bacterium]
MTYDQKILQSSKKIDVLNYPVGLNIYFFNPFRICNMSTGTEWKKLSDSVRTCFNRFLAFYKINKLEKDVVGPGADLLLNPDLSQEWKNVKADLNKPNNRLIWKIFWLDPKQTAYDKL